ncbi:hypothetical protein L0664_05000 [Octadecabacter sp. G9-8]|uniref:Uncharacterized protein n=1 Tax=Octadecabacter dasysiphoniae TaxID=2909341 RepID=A0ABS9CT67_9RHOB|nr:hypothetical protein [Octadecabacter dasysiphoniae]MCF2870417.1 hypothetical protein [Octadecabacter dasysiphoniae]
MTKVGLIEVALNCSLFVTVQPEVVLGLSSSHLAFLMPVLAAKTTISRLGVRGFLPNFPQNKSSLSLLSGKKPMFRFVEFV